MAEELATVDNAMSRRTTLIRPSRGWLSFSFWEIWEFRDLFWLLSLRSIKLRYKQTAIGLTWVIIQPLLAAGVLAVVFGKLGNLPDDGVPYLLIVYMAMLPWNIFSQVVGRGGVSLVTDRQIVGKTYFPRAILPLACTLAVLFDFMVALVFGLFLIVVHGHSLSWSILALPLMMLIVFILAAGLVLAVSSLNVYFRDVAHALPYLLQILLFASPIAYSLTLIPEEWRTLYQINPFVGLAEGFRWALIGGREFPAEALGVSFVVSVLVLLGGAVLFNRLERGFADVI